MDMRSRVNAALKQAMKDKAAERLSTLRLINAAIKDRDIALRTENRTDGVGDGEVLQILGKLAMADIFLIALYITLAKGISYATIETAWGLYLFTGCILASIALGYITEMTSTSRKP